MQNMSNSTKLLLGGAAVALMGAFLPFFGGASGGSSLADYTKWDSGLYFTLFGLLAMVLLCFFPSIYQHNSRSFVTYQLGAWLANILFFFIFYMNKIAPILRDLSEISQEVSEWLEIFGMDNLQSNLSFGIGAILYAIGNVIFAYGLYQTWQNVGGGYPPVVYDPGEGHYPAYPDTMPVEDYPPAPPYQAPPADYKPAPTSERYAPPKPQKPKTQAWLVDDYSGRSYQLVRGTTSIGRQPNNDICLTDPKVSKHHAKIIEEKGHYRLVDLASTNGTYVNGKIVRQPLLLYPDDTIRFGDRFKVRFVGMKR